MSVRTVFMLAAMLCALPLGGAAAQQASDSLRVPVPALTESVNVPASPLPAPTSVVLQRQESLPAPTSVVLQRPEPLPAVRLNLTPAPALAAPAVAGQHTFVISTLALVLGIILIVVLID